MYSLFSVDLGGDKDFAELVAAAKARNIKLLVDSTSKLGARKAHRKYKGLTCWSQDKKGYTVATAGNDRYNKNKYPILYANICI